MIIEFLWVESIIGLVNNGSWDVGLAEWDNDWFCLIDQAHITMRAYAITSAE